MATVVDALTVTLGLDASGFTKGQRETQEALKKTETEAARTAKTLQAEGGRAAEFFTAAKVEALALLGVLAGGAGLIAGFKETAAGLNAIQRAATGAGESTQWMQAFGAAIGRTGGNISAAQQQMVQFAATVMEFRLHGGLPGLVQYQSQLGINNLNTAMPHEIIEAVMRMIETKKDPIFMKNAMTKMGIGGDLQDSLLQIGSVAALHAAIRRSYELGAVQTQKQIDAAIKFQGAVTEFQQAVEGLATALIPFEWMAKKISGLTEDIIHPPKIKSDDEGSGYNQLRRWSQRWFGYDPGPSGAKPHPGASGGSGISSGGRASAIAEGLMARGMDHDTAWAFAANGMAESGGIPGAMERGGGPGRGLFQITSQNRKDDYQRLYGHSPEQGTRDEQLDFVMWELKNTERGAAMRIAGAQGVEAKAAAVSRYYERPKDVEGEAAKRSGMARDLTRGSSVSPIVPRQMLRPEDMMSPIGPTSSNSSTETTIGHVNVYPPNGDSKSIAQSIKQALAREILETANTGMV